MAADQKEAYELPNELNGQTMGKQLDLLEDPTGSLSTEDVAHRLTDFHPAAKDSPSFGFTRSAHWARLRLRNPGPQERRLALLLTVPSIDSALLVCLPGHGRSCSPLEIGDHQAFSRRPIRHRNPVFPLRLGAGQTADYLLRLQGTGAVAFRLQLWDPPLLRSEIESERLLFGLYYGLMLAMLIYNTFLLIAVRDRAYLFYSLFILAFMLLQAAMDGNGFQYLWPNAGKWSDLTVPGFGYATAIAAAQFTRIFIDTRKYTPLFEKLFLVFMGLCTLGSAWLGITALIGLRTLVLPSNIAMLLGIVLSLLASGIALHRGSRPALFYLVGWSGFLLGSTALILRNVGVLPNMALLDWSTQIGSAALVLLLSLGLADLINTMRRRLAAYNAELERDVKERTRDLNESLEEVQRLHQKQVGDYYLISLISNPLSSNRSLHAHLRAESLIRQHKRFSFKDRESEIGGDLCITDRMDLGGGQFLAFINADAMGKSIQGAGGSIVVGAVFSTLLERTRHSVDMKSHSPERWLHYAYKELDRVFVSFGGNMLVSCVMGLIEEGTNCLFFINAEHPAPVILREGQAGFVGTGSFHPRLGAGLQDLERCPINVFALRPRDALILGSDGRDDIRVVRGDRTEINSDERRFLAIVEEAGGDLARCFEIMRNDGELTDDLSLIRIDVPEDGPVLESHEGLENLRRRARLELDERNYAAAADTLVHLVRANPAVSEHLHSAAKCLKRAGRLPEAVEAAERFFLRSPGDLRGLLNLCELLVRVGTVARAKKILGLARTLAPDEPRIRQLAASLADA